MKRWIDGNLWSDGYKGYNNLIKKEKELIKHSIQQAAAPILLRNWMETRILLINYIYSSPKSPYAPVEAIFARDEYQKDKGNLPHIHLILSVQMEKLNDQQKKKLDNIIRASVCSIRTHEEIQELIDEGVFKSWDDIQEIHKIGAKILSHHCDARCLRRIGDGDGPENFKCRKLNNLKVSPDNTRDSYISIETKRNKECIDRLIKIGMADPISINKFGVPSEFHCYHNYFHPKRHIPPTNPNEQLNISPVEGYTFCILKSMQNIQSLTHTNGLNRYVCKYIGKIDEQNQIIVRSHPYNQQSLISNSRFLHNTKITSSSINESRALAKKRNRHHPKGRAVSLMEMLQILLSYPQTRTDMCFVIIATVPLEQRAGIEKNVSVHISSSENVDENEDGIDSSILCDKIRKQISLPKWRQLRTMEKIMLQGVQKSNISVDKVTQFSLRPPELREIVTQVESYYRWFHIGN